MKCIVLGFKGSSAGMKSDPTFENFWTHTFLSPTSISVLYDTVCKLRATREGICPGYKSKRVLPISRKDENVLRVHRLRLHRLGG